MKAATCIACSRPTVIEPLYLNLVLDPSSESTNEGARHISTRLKDVFMKTWTITGIPSVITAVTSLAKAEQQNPNANPNPTSVPSLSDQTQKSHYYPLQLTPTLERQGHSFMLNIYQHNLNPIMSTWGSHQADFEWLEKRIIYGLFLSDHKILTAVETEIVVLAAMMCQELKPPALWHVRGMRRLGISREGVQELLDCVKRMNEYWGRGTDGWISAGDVDGEV